MTKLIWNIAFLAVVMVNIIAGLIYANNGDVAHTVWNMAMAGILLYMSRDS